MDRTIHLVAIRVSWCHRYREGRQEREENEKKIQQRKELQYQVGNLEIIYIKATGNGVIRL